MNTIDDVIKALGGPTTVAKYLTDYMGEPVPVTTVAAWQSRNVVSDYYKFGLVAMAGQERLVGVTHESLAAIGAKKKVRGG
jgi:hypothetical protein